MTAADDAPEAVSFEDVLKAERKQIHESRVRRLAEAGPEDPGTSEQFVGLALSGGGERSATFSLGVLQGLARFGLLRHLDYLSTTGGGAEIAGWLYGGLGLRESAKLRRSFQERLPILRRLKFRRCEE